MKAVIFAPEGEKLIPQEKDFFAQAQPYGFILMGRNCVSKAQVKALTDSLKQCCPAAEIFIDQEGGRVARLKPPVWDKLPSARQMALLGPEKTREYGRKLGQMLSQIGITANCAPVCDLAFSQTDASIGDRAFAADPKIVTPCAKALIEGMAEYGVKSVIKHLPGLGRGQNDTHKQETVIDADLDELRGKDFIPFIELADCPYGMVSHATYTKIDHRPASISKKLIDTIIRRELSYTGLIISDDITMQALSGDMGQRAKQTIDAGCDLTLHCNGKMDEMIQIAQNVPDFSLKNRQLSAKSRHGNDSAPA